jgi:hypothetical protein
VEPSGVDRGAGAYLRKLIAGEHDARRVVDPTSGTTIDAAGL